MKTSTPPATLAQKIAQHPLLSDCTPEHIEILADCALEVSYAPGEVIFRQGDPANRFYLIQSGQVQLQTEHGAAIPIQVIGPGEVLGWSWLVPPHRWQFGAQAIEETHAVFLYGTRLRESCEENPRLGYILMRAMALVLTQRLQAARRKLIVQEAGRPHADPIPETKSAPKRPSKARRAPAAQTGPGKRPVPRSQPGD